MKTMNSTENNDEKSKRAKARWMILRKALIDNRTENHASSITNNRDNYQSDTESYSIHRFEGFQVFHRNVLMRPKKYKDICYFPNDPDYINYEIIEYEIPMQKSHNYCVSNRDNKNLIVKVRTREKIRDLQQKVKLKDLMSHVHYGVDNTGNTCVWDSSSVLAYCVTSCPFPLITNPSFPIRIPFVGFSNILSLSRNCQKKIGNKTFNRRLRVVELGAGMASLPLLSLAAVASCLGDAFKLNDMPFIDCVITDGHPKAVENNIVCSNLTLSLYDESNNFLSEKIDNEKIDNIYSNSYCAVQTHQLLWKANDEGFKECHDLLTLGNKNGQVEHFDLVLVSDCIHFTEFHAGLICTIGRLLRVNGYCLLCQPKRGKSLDQFMQMINAINCNENGYKGSNGEGLFDLKLYRDFDESISKKHQKYSEVNYQGYDENIHYPLVLVLRKLRSFNEDVDTDLATKYFGEGDK